MKYLIFFLYFIFNTSFADTKNNEDDSLRETICEYKGPNTGFREYKGPNTGFRVNKNLNNQTVKTFKDNFCKDQETVLKNIIIYKCMK